MTPRGRTLVLALSLPVMIFAVVGGFMGRTMAAQNNDSYQYLRIFSDVVGLITSNYVEEPNPEQIMRGAMHGLADGLDPDSAYLTAEQARSWEQQRAPEAGGTGLELTRQYYLRVIAARDGSPAAKAGLRPGDYIRAIDGQSTRDVSVVHGARLLRGAPGSTVKLTVLRGNAAEPREVELRREALAAAPATGRMHAAGVGYVRVPEFSAAAVQQLRSEAAALGKQGATQLLIDVRGNAFGEFDQGLAAARLFVGSGNLAYTQERGRDKQPIAASGSERTVTMPVALLTDGGTAGAAELFAAALKEGAGASLVGERTQGRAGRQRLVKLPDGSALLLTYATYLTPGGAALHEKGLIPDVPVDQPEVEFGAPPPATDATLDKAVEQLGTRRKAA